MSDWDCIRLNCPNWAGDGLCMLTITCWGSMISGPGCRKFQAGDSSCPLVNEKAKPEKDCPEWLFCPAELEEEIGYSQEEFEEDNWEGEY